MIFGLEKFFRAPAMAAGCPWSEYVQSSRLFCEEALCELIKQPANSWSCAGYLLAGGWILRKARNEKTDYLRSIGWLAIFIGLTSFAYHASLILTTELMDFGSMLLMSSLLITLNLKLLFGIHEKLRRTLYWSFSALSILSLFSTKDLGAFVFVGHMITMLITQIMMAFRLRGKVKFRFLVFGMSALVLATFIWALDFTRAACNPHNHFFQGHALWHLLTAASMALVYRFYKENASLIEMDITTPEAYDRQR